MKSILIRITIVRLQNKMDIQYRYFPYHGSSLNISESESCVVHFSPCQSKDSRSQPRYRVHLRFCLNWHRTHACRQPVWWELRFLTAQWTLPPGLPWAVPIYSSHPVISYMPAFHSQKYLGLEDKLYSRPSFKSLGMLNAKQGDVK